MRKELQAVLVDVAVADGTAGFAAAAANTRPVIRSRGQNARSHSNQRGRRGEGHAADCLR